MLRKDQLEVARAVALRLTPGHYTVKEFYGDEWEREHRPKHFGKQFKAAVLHDDIPGLRWVGQNSDRSQVYEVLPA